MHRADDRVLICDCRHARQGLAQVNAGHVGANRPKWAADIVRRVRLGVERLKLARPTDEEEDNAVLRRPARRSAVKIEAGQREAGGRGADGAGLEEVAPAQRLGWVHGGSPSGCGSIALLPILIGARRQATGNQPTRRSEESSRMSFRLPGFFGASRWQLNVYAPQRGQGRDSSDSRSYTDSVIVRGHPNSHDWHCTIHPFMTVPCWRPRE